MKTVLSGVSRAGWTAHGRIYQAMLILSTLGLSWLGMQIVHEAGHVAVAWASGETVERVVLHPLAISRTDTSHDHHPLLTVWGGPLLGGVGDAGDLIRYGATRWTLVVFGLVAAPLGLYLWHGLGPHFGWGEARGRVSRGAAFATMALLATVVFVELVVGGE